MVLMRKHGTNAAPRAAPVFMWLGPLAGFLKFGTDGYPRAVQRRLRIVNAMTLLIAVFSVIYAAVFAYYDAEHYRHLIVVNLLLAVIVLLVPLAHRINDIAAAVLIAIVEYVALFFFVRVFGHESGIQINYIIAAAVAFAIYGLSHFRIAVAVIAAGLVLHLAAWFLFPPERALFNADPSLLANLYISSAATTFGIIALIVGYAFTVADRARAEADAPLTNILPEAIAERLKERPGETCRRQRRRSLSDVQRSRGLHRTRAAARRGAHSGPARPDRHRVRSARSGPWRGEDQDDRRWLHGRRRGEPASGRPSCAARTHGAEVAGSRF
jgi:adenylate cyclase